ncbi:MAG: hypothetical protein WCO52_01705 [bacterium]
MGAHSATLSIDGAIAAAYLALWLMVWLICLFEAFWLFRYCLARKNGCMESREYRLYSNQVLMSWLMTFGSAAAVTLLFWVVAPVRNVAILSAQSLWYQVAVMTVQVLILAHVGNDPPMIRQYGGEP